MEKWKRESGVLCDRQISLMVKWKVYKTIVKPAMVYAAETWARSKHNMWRKWMSGVTKLDSIRNERIRGIAKVGEISKKVQESSFEVVWACIEKKSILCWQESDGEGGAGKENERKTEAEVFG